jgi:D-sedoheptulose 7-phosphate isomerase
MQMPRDIYFKDLIKVLDKLDYYKIELLVNGLRKLHGRLFILGVGGSAANASHAVNDFRKIAKIEAYCLTDNVAELSARTNDEGWEHSFWKYLVTSKLNKKDAILVLSVGGGGSNVSMNIVKCLHLAKEKGAKIFGIVSRDGGKTAEMADYCVLIPVVNEYITPYAESFQAIIWHYLAERLK